MKAAIEYTEKARIYLGYSWVTLLKEEKLTKPLSAQPIRLTLQIKAKQKHCTFRTVFFVIKFKWVSIQRACTVSLTRQEYVCVKNQLIQLMANIWLFVQTTYDDQFCWIIILFVNTNT